MTSRAEGVKRMSIDTLSHFDHFVQRMFLDTYKTPYIFGDHHRSICRALESVVMGDCKRLIINIAPRYGKTELVSKMFIAWGFALNPASKFIHLSYSFDLARSNAMSVRDIMLCEWYRILFPYVHIVGTGASNWATSDGGKMYAVSSGGQVTGFGAGAVDSEPIDDDQYPEYTDRFAGAIVIDDPIKPDDALSDKAREAVNYRFESTIRSRANSRNTPIVIIMQRLHENDLCGFLQRNEPEEWTVLSLPCITAEGTALWEHKHTLEELKQLERVQPFVFQTQYMQNPTPLEGLMYERFKEYDTLPVGPYVMKNYTDTADTGADYLCSICYAEYTSGECYVTDVLYTDKPMEYTENQTARMLVSNGVRVCVVESNNGGRGFRRNVERLVREMGNRQMTFSDLTQTKNKQSRIFSRSAEVQNMVYFPRGWDRLHPLYANALRSYRKAGRNSHDDAPDATTGIVEMLSSQQRTRLSRT